MNRCPNVSYVQQCDCPKDECAITKSLNIKHQMKPQLESATFHFSQDGNCVDRGDNEFLEVRCESSLGIDNDKGCFYVLKTEAWSIDSVEDLQKLFDRIHKSIKL